MTKGTRLSPIESELQLARQQTAGSGLLGEGLIGASGAGVPAVGKASSVSADEIPSIGNKQTRPDFRSSQLDGLEGD